MKQKKQRKERKGADGVVPFSSPASRRKCERRNTKKKNWKRKKGKQATETDDADKRDRRGTGKERKRKGADGFAILITCWQKIYGRRNTKACRRKKNKGKGKKATKPTMRTETKVVGTKARKGKEMMSLPFLPLAGRMYAWQEAQCHGKRRR